MTANQSNAGATPDLPAAALANQVRGSDGDPRQPVLEASGLIKTFGRVVGLDGVDQQLYPREVLAIIGDNGAGKSTLIKCLTGAAIPDQGQIYLDGVHVHFRRPRHAHV